MLKKLILNGLFLWSCIPAMAQVLISQNPNQIIDSSAQLEVRSSQRGFLPPVMNTSSRMAIPNPAKGLMVFDSLKQKMYVFTTQGWRPLAYGYDSLEIGNGYAPEVPDLSAGAYMGVSCALGTQFAIAGASRDAINGNSLQGSAYLYAKTSEGWKFQQKIVAPDGNPNDYFGFSVAIMDDFLFIGAPGKLNGSNGRQGAVYVYRIDNNNALLHQKIVGTGLAANDYFGWVIQAKEDDLLVGAPYDDNASNPDQGSVYYFKREQNFQYFQVQKIINTINPGASDFFGGSISISGNKMAVGHEVATTGSYGYSKNSVYVYEKFNNSWFLTGGVNQPDGLDNTEGFSYSLSLSDNNLIVGANFHNFPEGNKDRGAAYVFNNEDGNWAFKQKLTPTDLSQGTPGNIYGDYLGYKMARHMQYVLIGAHFEDLDINQNDRGAVFLYEQVNNEMKLIRRISSPFPQLNEYFGSSVAIDANTIMVGAQGNSSEKGTVYFFDLN